MKAKDTIWTRRKNSDCNSGMTTRKDNNSRNLASMQLCSVQNCGATLRQYLDAEVQKEESKVDAFGIAHSVVKELIAGYQPHSKSIIISSRVVLDKLCTMGLGSLNREDWEHLVGFRILLTEAQASFLLDCLFQVCHGRLRTLAKTYGDIKSMHHKGHAWP